jgi:hypothetical protein
VRQVVTAVTFAELDGRREPSFITEAPQPHLRTLPPNLKLGVRHHREDIGARMRFPLSRHFVVMLAPAVGGAAMKLVFSRTILNPLVNFLLGPNARIRAKQLPRGKALFALPAF